MPDQVDRLRAALADRYRVEREIGRGGMATVFLAEDLKHHRKVALKVLRPELAATIGPERFLREVEVTAKLSHPHVLPLHDSGDADGVLYYVMPYVEGETLRDRIAREGQLPLDDALQITCQVAAALTYAHSLGVVHRDIKPENVLFSAGMAVVADFGIARAVSEAGAGNLTEPGMSVGTPAYMSPEQASGAHRVDARSDIYALGCVLYEMLGGETPYAGATPQALLAKKLSEPTPHISVVRETVPAAIEAALMKALAKAPADRFATARQFAEALVTAGVGVPSERGAPTGAAAARDQARGWPWTGWRHRPGLRRWIGAAAAIVVVGGALVSLSVTGLRARLGVGTTGETGVIRLAVLPFENLTGDPDQEYLSDGLTEEMITQLGQLHPRRLSVIGRLSVMRYKNSGTPIDQIGRELHVDHVLAGSARREAGRIRINAELIRVRGQTQVWAEAYESELSGILALQRDVARRVAGALALELLPAEEARLASGRTVDPAAYEAYLKGSQSRLALTEGGLETAERYFTSALQIDPDYATAWAGIARVWMGRGQMGLTPPQEAQRRAKEAVLRALALDASEYEAHRALCGILTWGEWDWPAAERQWHRNFEVNPNDGEALAGYSHFLMHMGRPDEAMAQVEQALALDPFNVKLRSFYVTDLVYVRRYGEAIAEAREILRLQPDAPVARAGLYYALYVQGLFDDALAEDRKRIAGDAQLTAALERGYAAAGYRGAQQRMADLRASRYGTSGGPDAYGIALGYLYAGNHDQALEWLERAYQEGNGNMPYLGLPIFDALRSDPRFQQLWQRMRLPPTADRSSLGSVPAGLPGPAATASPSR